MSEKSFETRKFDYFQERGEEVTRAAYLSPDVTVVSFAGRGNRLSFIYDPLTVNSKTNYKGEVASGVGVIDDAAFAPGVLGFDEAMHLSRTMFEPLEGKIHALYERPKVTRDLPHEVRDGHPRKERDRL